MVQVEELLSVFERQASWDWIRRHFLHGLLVCPRCGAKIKGEKPKRSFVELRRTFCQDCGVKFTPTEGTPLHGTRWQPEDLVRLLFLHQSGRGRGRISKALNKSPASVRDMVDRINIANPDCLEDQSDNPPAILPRVSG